MKQTPPSSVLANLMALSGMGFTIAIPIVAGTLAGRYLDGITHTGSLFLLLGLLLGLIAGVLGAYRLFRAVFKV